MSDQGKLAELARCSAAYPMVLLLKDSCDERTDVSEIDSTVPADVRFSLELAGR